MDPILGRDLDMNKIFKFPLEPEMTLALPKEGAILSIQMEDSRPYMYILFNPEQERVERKFVTYETGQDVPDAPGLYIGTFQIVNGGGNCGFFTLPPGFEPPNEFVFHVFEQSQYVMEMLEKLKPKINPYWHRRPKHGVR